MDLKLLNERLGIPLDASEEQALEKVAEFKKEAQDGRVWRLRAEENLEKLENDARLVRENEELRADAYFMKAKAAYKITAHEEVALRKLYMEGDAGRKAVEAVIESRSEQEYMSRVQSIRGVKEQPTDVMAEIESRANELIAKEPGLSKGEAQSRVLKADFNLQRRYDAKFVPGVSVSGGAQ